MRIPRIYTEQLLQPGATVQLEPGPSQHIARALRMREGASLLLFNGRGGIYVATVASLGKKSVTVAITEHLSEELESPLRLELGIAISRGDRMDWVIQKATELGVASITPLMTERTEIKLKGDRADKKLAHWRQIVISACEQSGRNRLPTVEPVGKLANWLPTVKTDRRFVLHHRDTSAKNTGETPASAAILIGPEGGLSPEEISEVGNFDFEALTLGPRVLRTETAPLAAIAILQAQWGDMSALD
ncbi:MAG: 16S rRNA (uracil(1498)-N(3))-methyltransferase [Halioglobus sp.]